MKNLLRLLSVLVLATATAATVLTVPASAQPYQVTVTLADGTVQSIVVDLPPGTTIDQLLTGEVELPVSGTPVSLEQLPEETPPPDQPAPPTPPDPVPPSLEPPPAELPPTEPPPDAEQLPPTAQEPTTALPPHVIEEPHGAPGAVVELRAERMRRRGRRSPLRNPDGTPTPSNPGFTDVLPGPSTATGVPNFIIRKFRVPPFLLPIYQAAGIEYGIRWEVLAAINEIESDYGRNLNVSSAGALGWMQFMPATWKMYGTDANKDGRKDPYNPVDAIFAAARYLKAANYENDVRAAIWAYNHADWYVDSVLLRARLIAGVPADLIGSLTGLTEGRFPVYARARYADDIAEQQLLKRVNRGENAANLVESDDSRRSIDIFASKGSPVVAVNDGVIKKIGRSGRLGRHLVLQDVYGNRYTYAHLGEISNFYPVPNNVPAADVGSTARGLPADDDLVPEAPASSGRQLGVPRSQGEVSDSRRLFAHPYHPGAREAGGLEQQLEAQVRASGRYETYKNYFSRPFGLDPSKVRLRPLKKGSRVIGGTILARIGSSVAGKAAHVDFSIRPAGRGAPKIDPKPILDGWKLLEATAIYRANGKNVLRGGPTIGQILLLPKPLLEKRVLADQRIQIYACGRDDIRAGQIDRRVLATLTYLAESGLSPSVSSLKCGHGYYTKSGHVSHHSSGNAVDIARINGIPVLGHQEPAGIVDQTVRRIAQLQGTFSPAQVISLFDFGPPTMAMADHGDHIHVGFRPAGRAGEQASESVLKPSQWPKLLRRLRRLPNPVVEAGPRGR